MINLTILFDDTDPQLGQYFTDCFNDVKNVSFSSNIKLNSINSQNRRFINQILKKEDNTIFVAFTHGESGWLGTVNGSSIFIDNGNAELFNNSCFYTTACSCGEELGKILIQKGCRVFIGYDDTVKIDLQYEDIFMKCENYGIKEFISTNKSWDDVIIEAKELFTNEADMLFDEGGVESFLVGSELLQNRDKFCLYGDGSIRLSDLQN
jgi:hypothetical protein